MVYLCFVLNRIIRIYIYGYWHIALCAFVLYIGVDLFKNNSIDYNTGLHIFASTFFIYNLHRFVSVSKMGSVKKDRYNYMSLHMASAKYLLLFSGLISLYTFFYLITSVQIAILIAAFISIGYILPIVFRKRLRDLGKLKIILISIVWALLPVFPFLTSSNYDIVFYIFLEHFFFIFALTIPFDFRDRSLDERTQVSNLANQMGVKRLNFILACALLCSIILAGVIYMKGVYHFNLFVGLICFYLIQYVISRDLEQDHSRWYYLFILDGFILIKGLLYFIP